MKKEKRVETIPATSSPSPGPPGSAKRNKHLTVDVSIKNTGEFKALLNIFTQIMTDERIDKSIRQSYLDEFISNVGD